MKFEESALAALAMCAHVRATVTIAPANLALYGRRNVPGMFRGGPGRTPRPVCRRELRSLKILDQRRQRALENDSGVSIWNGVAQ